MIDIINLVFALLQIGWTFRGYIVALLVFLLGIRFKSSKYVTWIYGVYFWILIGLNTVSADYDAYKEMYYFCNAERYSSHEIGYMALCRLFYSFGLPFEVFRAIVGVIIAVLLINGIKKLTDKPNFVFALMLVFPFISFVSGLRNSLSMAIVIHGFSYLLNSTSNDTTCLFSKFRFKYDTAGNIGINSEETKRAIVFAFYVVLACLFHYASVFYFVFLYAKFSKKKTIYLLFQTFALIVAAIGLSRIGFFYSIISRYTSREKTLYWFSSNSGSMSVSVLYILSVFLIGIMLYILYQCKLLAEQREKSFSGDSVVLNSSNISIVLKAVVLSLLAFAGAVFSSVVFLRWVLTPIPLAYCVFATYLMSHNEYDNDQQWGATTTRLFIYFFVVLVTMFVFGYWIGGDSLTMYTNNLVFQ